MKWRFVRERSGQPNHQCLESDKGGYLIAKYTVGEPPVDKYAPWHKNTPLMPIGTYATSFEQAKTICEDHHAANK